MSKLSLEFKLQVSPRQSIDADLVDSSQRYQRISMLVVETHAAYLSHGHSHRITRSIQLFNRVLANRSLFEECQLKFL